MGRINGERSDEGKGVTEIMIAEFALFVLGQFGITGDADAERFEETEQDAEHLALAELKVTHHGTAPRNLLVARAPVHREFMEAGDHLLLEAADSLHEKFVKIRRGN